ncbi:GntR family transcriptional repressor for pyruvate dehydrogenase complex [Bradyrhizobium ottawaense]
MELKRATEGEKGFEKVFAFLRERLLAGSLKPGDRLISERELATLLGVSRPIVREALRALTVLGIVEIRDRIGTVVTRPDVSVLNDFFTFALAQQADMLDDVMQARVAIECQAIRLACERANIADFERLQRALAKIGETIDEADAGGMADFDFHRAIVVASHSETLTVLHGSLAGALDPFASQPP